jgi:hypothetical protein
MFPDMIACCIQNACEFLPSPPNDVCPESLQQVDVNGSKIENEKDQTHKIATAVTEATKDNFPDIGSADYVSLKAACRSCTTTLDDLETLFEDQGSDLDAAIAYCQNGCAQTAALAQENQTHTIATAVTEAKGLSCTTADDCPQFFPDMIACCIQNACEFLPSPPNDACPESLLQATTTDNSRQAKIDESGTVKQLIRDELKELPPVLSNPNMDDSTIERLNMGKSNTTGYPTNRHAMMNCYQGKGGNPLGQASNQQFVQGCQVECSKNSQCNCIVYDNNPAKSSTTGGRCWLLKSCNTNQCVTFTGNWQACFANPQPSCYAGGSPFFDTYTY